jgi:hypothetical protein
MKLLKLLNLQIAKLDSVEFQIICKHIFWGFFSLYAIYQIYIFMHWRAMVPDEISFIGIAHNFSIFHRSTPPANYGSLYWFILSVLYHPAVIRFFMLGLFLSIPLLIMHGQRYHLKLISLLLFLSFPYAFWTGKLIGPEILSLWFISCSLAFLNRNIFWSATFAGISVGIKLTSIPFLIFYFFLIFVQNKFKDNILKVSLYIIFGFVFANPFNFDLYLMNIFKGNLGEFQSSLIDTPKLINSLFNFKITWDNVIGSSFSQLISNPYIVIIYSLVLLIGTPIYGIAFFIFLVATIVSVLYSHTLYAWYFFPVVSIWIYSLRFLQIAKLHIHYYLVFVVIVLFILNFLFNIQYSIFQASEKFKQINTITHYPSTCVFNEIKRFNPTILLNRTDFGWNFNAIPNGLSFKLEDLLASNYSVEDEKFMLLASSRMLIHIPKNISLKLQTQCEDIYIFTNK